MDFQKTKYVIREVAFMYNDEYFYPALGFGGIKKSFDNLEEATEALKELTQQSLSGASPEEFESISYCHKDENEASKQLNGYLENTFGKPLLITSTYSDGKVPDRDYTFPQLTKEQAWEIRNISGIKHFELVKIDSEQVSFWGIQEGSWGKVPGRWVKSLAMRMKDHVYEEKAIELYFNSEDEAYVAMDDLTYYISQTVRDGLKGSYEELSDTPQILSSLVERNPHFSYDEPTQTLTVGQPMADDFKTLNSLLKKKMVEVVPFPVEKLEELGDGWQPMM